MSAAPRPEFNLLQAYELSEKDIQLRWQKALDFYRERKSVLFLSYGRFWERHGFVQQSLAYALAEAGVKVLWLDGSGWRRYRPVVKKHPNLVVKQLPSIPGRRLPAMDQIDLKLKARYCQRAIRSLPGNPVVWVQAGLDERLAAALPYIDAFSVFDDPYRHSPMGALCQRAKTIVCQNQKALDCVKQFHASKAQVVLPPVDMSAGVFAEDAKDPFPEKFPKEVFGYIGSFENDGFDLLLFEDFIRSFPQYGFLLMGRTDKAGMELVQRFARHPNFLYLPWVERSQLAAVWRRLSLTLLFYRPNRTQDGAFPVKVLESARFGVPCLATAVHKTEGLHGVFPRSSIIQTLKALVPEAMALQGDFCQTLYKKLSVQMHPKLHLAHVAECLTTTPLQATPPAARAKRSNLP